MQKKEEILESFKTAIKSTIKSISNKEDIEISFGGQDVSSENNKLRLPEINEFQNRINFDLTRAQADSESLKLRYCNKKVLKIFEPAGSKAKRLYEIAEKIRYESLGAQEYKGIKDNLLSYYEKLKPPQNKTENIYFAFENYLRGEFFKYIENAGGTNNANTTNDRTFYYEVLPSNQLELGLWLESERMLHAKIDTIGVETQNEVVKEEKRLRIGCQKI